MRRFVLALALVLVAAPFVGCQVPPATQHVVNLSWTAPVATGNWAGCTTANPCTYGIYRCTLSATACADTTNVAWGEITTATTRVSGTAYNDSTVGGGTYWYVAKTFQGTASSGPSNISQAVVPGVPTAPPLNTNVATNDAKPLIAVPAASEMAMAGPVLKVRVR